MKVRMKGFTLIELLIVVAIIAILAAIAVPNFLEAQVRAKVSRVHADERTYATGIEAYAVDWNEYPCSFCIGGSGGGPVGPSLAILPGITLKPLEEMLIPLSTPVAYLSDAQVEEPFNAKQGWLLFQGWNVLDKGSAPPDKTQRRAIYLYLALPADALFSNPIIMNYIQMEIQNNAPSGVTITGPDIAEMIQKRWYVIDPGPDTFYSWDRCMEPFNWQGGKIIPCIFSQVGDAALVKINGIYDPTNGTISQGEIVRTAEGISSPRL